MGVPEIREVGEFVNSILDEYSRVTGYPVPRWSSEPIRLLFEELLAGYDVARGKILVHGALAWEIWRRDKVKAQRFLRYVLAQEFWHYVQHFEGRIYTNIGRWLRPLIEGQARRRAEELSGISEEEAHRLTEELLGDSMMYDKEKPNIPHVVRAE